MQPSEPAGFWKDRPGSSPGATWKPAAPGSAFRRNGRFAAVTNYRGGRDANALESRGALVTRFLEGTMSAREYEATSARRGSTYSGFNLFADDGAELWWCSNRDGSPRHLQRDLRPRQFPAGYAGARRAEE
jgi:uncharacterized protein with NRDE domain